jgi:hypothetical protein
MKRKREKNIQIDKTEGHIDMWTDRQTDKQFLRPYRILFTNIKHLHCILHGGDMLFGYGEMRLGHMYTGSLTYMSKILCSCILPLQHVTEY